jgi:CRISPR system Cascade subunit CasE
MNCIHAAIAFPNPEWFPAKKDCEDPYQMHRTLTRLLWTARHSDKEKADLLRTARLLFRIDGSKSHPCVYIQSRIPFAWNSIEPEYWSEPPVCAAICNPPEKGRTFGFRLHARPVQCVAGKRRTLLSKEDQIEWFQQKASQNGFLIESVSCTSIFWRDSKKRHSPLLRSAAFEGTLRVVDSDQMFCAMANGIGRGKANGFGLLTLFDTKPFGF